MLKNILIALTAILVTAGMAVAEPMLFTTYGFVGEGVRGAGAGVTAAIPWTDVGIYLGGEVDETVVEMGEDVHSAALAGGVHFPVSGDSLSAVLYGTLGAQFEGAEQDAILGGGVRLLWSPFDNSKVGLTAGVRMTTETDPAVTVGVSW